MHLSDNEFVIRSVISKINLERELFKFNHLMVGEKNILKVGLF